MHTTIADRRRFTRVSRRLAVELADSSGSAPVRAWTQDLSLGGAMLGGAASYRVGTRLSVSMSGGASGPLELTGTVIPVPPGGGTRIRFEGLRTAERVKLLDYLFG